MSISSRIAILALAPVCLLASSCASFTGQTAPSQSTVEAARIDSSSVRLSELGVDRDGAFSSGFAQSHPSPGIRNRASTRIAVDRGERLSLLLSQLQSDDPAARTCAVTDLGFYPAHRAQIVPPLSRAVVHDKSKWVRRAAVKSLAKVAPREAIPLLELALKDSDRWVQHSAARALAQLRSPQYAKR